MLMVHWCIMVLDVQASSAELQLFPIPNHTQTASLPRSPSARICSASIETPHPYHHPRSPRSLQIDPLVHLNPLDLFGNLLSNQPHQDGRVVVVELGAPAAAEREPRLLREGGAGAVRVGACGCTRDQVKVNVRDDLGRAGP